MNRPAKLTPEPITIRDLYPMLDEEQQKEAEETLDRYVALALRIYERRQSRSDSPQAARLTHRDTGASMKEWDGSSPT